MISALDHINLRTARLAEMVDWYGAVLEMHPGPRPDFPFGGAWLYAGDQALVHLIEVTANEAAPGGGNLALEHAAFRAAGLGAFLDRLEAAGVPSKIRDLPGWPILQVNIWDPDGNHLHIDFDAAEAEGDVRIPAEAAP